MDDFSHATCVYLLKHKSDVYVAFMSFYNMIVTQFDTKIRILRFDNRGKYFLGSHFYFLDEFGIVHETTCLGTLEQNRVAERNNKQLLEIA